MTRWLDDQEAQVWRAYLAASTLLEDHLDRQLQRDAGMPHAYYALLALLSDAPGQRMRMTDLAERRKITRSRLSHAIARLEEKGWVSRAACPTDRRGQVAELTDAGRAVLVETAPGHVEAVRRAVFDNLTPEQVVAFGEACKAIAEALQPDGAKADLPWQR